MSAESEHYSFASDNFSGVHPAILEGLQEFNVGQHTPYGEDEHCQRATELLHTAFGLSEESGVYFVPTGTMANILGCAALLGPGEAIISPEDGHLTVHEKSAIKRIGHQVIPAFTDGGNLKLSPEAIEGSLMDHDNAAAVYLAQTTDRGLAYTKDELVELIGYCRGKGLRTLMDGARLANALAAEDNLTSKDFGTVCPDIFWVGGSKNGGEFGEALVISNEQLTEDFTSLAHDMGALAGKSWVIGAQFAKFFQPDASGGTLWLQLARNANRQADIIRDGLLNIGIELHFKEGHTNILFPVLPNNVLEELSAMGYHFYMPPALIDENRGRVRLVCSWDTTDETSKAFLAAVGNILS